MRIFITGGTSGIGLALAELYLKQGDEVAICGRDLSKLPEGFYINYPRAKTFEVDVLKKNELEQVIASFGEQGLDFVIASAGRSHGSKTKLPDFEASRNIIEINILGVLNTFGPAIKIMEKQGRGHVSAISSVAGFIGLPGASAYSASKAAVLKLCESYSLDLKKFGIDVSVIAPGFIDTPLTQQNDHSMPWIMPVEKSAEIIKSALDKKQVLIVFPWQMKYLMAILERLPRFIYRFIMKLPVANYSKN